jgi:hypothetical protein
MRLEQVGDSIELRTVSVASIRILRSLVPMLYLHILQVAAEPLWLSRLELDHLPPVLDPGGMIHKVEWGNHR